MIDYEPVARMLRRLRAADEAEVAGRIEWITGVKRRLGLVEHGEPAEQRIAEWEEDHCQADLPVAFCAAGRELGTSLTLELHDERVAAVRGHPWLDGNEIWLAKPQPEMSMDFPLLPEQVRCPGCTALMYPGVGDQSSHHSFCWIFHPRPALSNFGGLISGI